MNLLTQHLDTWTTAPNGMKKLRELILELAVRGLLVPQNTDDEPASVLLEKIAAEKAQLCAEGKIKKSAPLPKIADDEKPFELPNGWEWVKLSEIGHDWGQKTPDADFTYIDVGSINKELGLIANPQILTAEDAPSRARKIVKKGTVIYSTVRPYLLNIAVVNDDFLPEPIASTAFAIIHPYSGILASFVYRYLRSPSFINYVESCQTGIAYPAVNDKQFFSGLIPLPPENEQHRIVAKVDELMQLCDQLEQKQTSNQEIHAQLVSTLLTTLTQATDQQAFQAAWTRIAANFDSLFTTESSIEQLKQTILQLAVMGKLVEQEAGDEPASVLLEKIAQEKARLISEGKIKKSAPLPKIADDEKPFDLPIGWEWVRLGEIVSLLGDGIHGSPNYDNNGEFFFINGNNLSDGIIEIKDHTKRVSFDEFQKHKKELNERSVLVSINGTIGNVAFYNSERIILGKSACYFNLFENIDKHYIKKLINSRYFLEYAFSSATGTTIKNVSLRTMRELPVPFPAITEQHRIVAKVDELMALCDQLKTKLNTAQTLQTQLAEALVQQVV